MDGAIARAAAATLSRDAIWRDKPPLASDCEHDLRCLPIVEYRQTVLCAKCGGLDTALSVAIADFPGTFTISEDGRITRKIAPGDPETTGWLRTMGVPEDVIAEIVQSRRRMDKSVTQ